MKIILLHLYA